MTAHLLGMAAASGDVLSARDAARFDIDPNGLARLVRSGELVHVRRGAYVVGEVWRGASPERRLALRVRAVLRARDTHGEVATHQSALALHGLPLHGCPLDGVDLGGDVARVRNRSGLRVHPFDPRWTVVGAGGASAVDVAWALVQVGLRHGREPFVVAADAALARGSVDLAALHHRVGLLAGLRQAVRAGRWLTQLDPRSESPGESRLRLLLTDLRFTTQSQVAVEDRPGHVVARVDLLVGDWVVVEFDGLVKYGGADGRAALAAEKAREDVLRSLGYEVVRIVWADLARPGRVDALVRAAVARAAARHGGSH